MPMLHITSVVPMGMSGRGGTSHGHGVAAFLQAHACHSHPYCCSDALLLPMSHGMPMLHITRVVLRGMSGRGGTSQGHGVAAILQAQACHSYPYC